MMKLCNENKKNQSLFCEESGDVSRRISILSDPSPSSPFLEISFGKEVKFSTEEVEDYISKNGRFSLHKACDENTPLAIALVNHGCDITVISNRNSTALHEACRKLGKLQYIKQKNPSCDGIFFNKLYISTVDLVNLLLIKGADTNVRDCYWGRIPFDYLEDSSIFKDWY